MSNSKENSFFNFTLPKPPPNIQDEKYSAATKLEKDRRAEHIAAMERFLKTAGAQFSSKKTVVSHDCVSTPRCSTRAITGDEIFTKNHEKSKKPKVELPSTSTVERSAPKPDFSFLVPAAMPAPEVEVMSSSDDDDDNEDVVPPLPKIVIKEPVPIIPKEKKNKDPLICLSALSARFRDDTVVDYVEPEIDAILCISKAAEQYLKTVIVGAHMRGESRRVEYKDLKKKFDAKAAKRAEYAEMDLKILAGKDTGEILKAADKADYLKYRSNQTALRASAPCRKHSEEHELKLKEKNAYLITKDDVMVFLKNAKARDTEPLEDEISDLETEDKDISLK